MKIEETRRKENMSLNGNVSWSVTFIVATLLLSHIIHLFSTSSFLFLKFSTPYSKRLKKKNYFSPYLSILTITFPSTFLLPFLPLYLSTTLYFTIILPSLFSLYIHTYIHTYIYIYIFEFSSHSFRYTQLSISLRPSLFSPYVY